MSLGNKVVAIIGATAVGKTGIAVRLAESLGSEVISLDSRQMYRGVDIGTAKPTASELVRARHHLIDIAAPDEVLALTDVQARAYAAANELLARGLIPILAGGTGQYVWSVLEGWRIPKVEPDENLRRRLEEVADAEGPDALHAQLAEIDPVSAERIHPNNVRRVIRALEVWQHTGVPMSEAQGKGGPPWPVFAVGLRMNREPLYARIDVRIDQMIEDGLEEEVRGLVGEGLDFSLPALQSVGYREWRGLLAGELDREEVVRLIRKNTRRLVRMQGTWFRDDDPRLRWYDVSSDSSPDDMFSEIRSDVERFLAGTLDGVPVGRPQAEAGSSDADSSAKDVALSLRKGDIIK